MEDVLIITLATTPISLSDGTQFSNKSVCQGYERIQFIVTVGYIFCKVTSLLKAPEVVQFEETRMRQIVFFIDCLQLHESL